MEPPPSKYTVFKQAERLSFEDRQALSGIREAVTALEPMRAGKIAYWWLRREAWRFTPRHFMDRRQDDSFDLRHRVDTATRVELPGLTIRGANGSHGVYYQASPVGQTRRIIRSLSIRFEEYTFIDFGSGKGRVLLVASELPFRRVIGIEFAEELHMTCMRNIEKYTPRKSSDVSSVCADAADYDLPSDNLVVYLFNPFDRSVLSRVVSNLVLAKRRFRKDIFVIFHHCADRDLFEAGGDFERLADREKYVIYRMVATP